MIVDALWGDEPPASATNLVQGYVSDVRRLLGANRIQRRGEAYLLVFDPDRIDLIRFERQLGAARQMLNADPDAAHAAIHECAALARGPVFANITTHGVLTSLKARIDESVTEVDELSGEAALLCGGHTGMVPRLEELTALHPLREVFWAQLAVALYRSGGEPGIGKTRLAEEVAQRAAATGALVLHGRCDEHVNHPPVSGSQFTADP